jgi:hypothetical protein
LAGQWLEAAQQTSPKTKLRRGKGGAFQSESHCFYWHNGRPRPSRRTYCVGEGGSAGFKTAVRNNPGGAIPTSLQRRHRQGAAVPGADHSGILAQRKGSEPEPRNIPLGAATPNRVDPASNGPTTPDQDLWPASKGTYDITTNQSAHPLDRRLLCFREAGLPRVPPPERPTWLKELTGGLQPCLLGCRSLR